ncbi:sensor histidine kinase [Lachnoclostridium sp. Marseille-P6806]|uniref:sensor histidine kinase n=1 Tax=Lachnoclostridium sp. Marseille-P6806 TaxID=2364793 RepID=UPI0010300113|nr:HAMP domain-containing sensor histidine kinase [Lachnoclostridium sp. Marseille-P6806]
MTFKRRLVVAFSIVLLVPLFLTSISFIVIGNYLTSTGEATLRLRDYSELTDNLQAYGEMTDSILRRVYEDIGRDPDVLEDREYLAGITEELQDRNSFILVRRGAEIYYTGNEGAAQEIFDQLPEYSGSSGIGTYGYYMGSADELVKQLDFLFADGAEGSLFIITRVITLVSHKFLVSMLLAMIIVLLATALFLIEWLQKGVIEPVSRLNVAMRNIRDGNLTYMLPTTENGEIGDLYQNYEDMRLRLKESADEKLEHEKQNRELIRNISHDLKTPITSVKGYVEGLMDGVANTPEKQSKYLQTIYSKANEMDRLINELTLYSRIDSDRIPYNFHRINVAEYFGDCVEEIGMDMESRGTELNYSNLVPPDTRIIADPEQLRRVVNNIIGNSVKYMDKPKGRIDIRILDEQDSIRIEIEDNGKGISARDLPQIFDRFYRTDSSRNSAQGGSGIGLSIVKKIIEDHGGYIWATSREGEGTCMHFVLRKYRENTDQDESVEAQAEVIDTE